MSTLNPQLPSHRTILTVDIEGSTARVNTAKAHLRETMYLLVEQALLASGVADDYRDEFIDRGDGILALIHPVDDVPKTRLLRTVVPTLENLLVDYASRYPDVGIRMRAVVHAGDVHYDSQGCFGEALDIAFRLLDAPEVKRAFRASSRPLMLVISDDFYKAVIRDAHTGIDPHSFVPLAHVRVGDTEHTGWTKLPVAAANRRDASPVTFDDDIDLILHHAGEELDDRAGVWSMSPIDVVEQLRKKFGSEPQVGAVQRRTKAFNDHDTELTGGAKPNEASEAQQQRYKVQKRREAIGDVPHDRIREELEAKMLSLAAG